MVTNRPLWVTMAFLLSVLFISTVAAEELSFSQAVELALKNNPTIAAGQLLDDAAKQAIRSANALANPEISVAPSIVGDAGADSAIFLSQPLEINGTRRIRGKIATFEAAAVSLDAFMTRQDMLLQVKLSYWDVVRAQEAVQLNQDNLQYLDALSAAVQKQYDVGVAPGSQVIKMEVEIAKARQELLLARLELTQTKAALNAMLNRPKNSDFTASDQLEFSAVTINNTELQASALAQRPEIAAAQAQLAAAQYRIKATQLRLAPDIAIQARKETLKSDSDIGVALSVTLPILDWGSVKFDKRHAESMAKSQEKQLEAIKNKVALDVEQAIQSVATSSQIINEYQDGILDKSEQLAQMARVGYEKGATSYLEVLEAQRTLRSVKTEYYSALANYAKALAQLGWAAGRDSADIEVKK